MKNSTAIKIARWTWRNSLLSMGILYGVSLIVYIAFSVAVALTGVEAVIMMRPATGIWLFIMGIVTYQQCIRVGLSHGVSRLSVWRGLAVHALSMAAVTALADTVLAVAFNPWTNTAGFAVADIGSIIRAMNPEMTAADVNSPGIVAQLALLQCLGYIVSGLAAVATGYFVGAGYYRMNSLAKILVTVLLPLAFMVGLIVLAENLLTGWLSDAIIAFATWALSGLNMLLVFGVVAVALMSLVWPMMRRAPIKAAS
jgi:hypothetical protein